MTAHRPRAAPTTWWSSAPGCRASPRRCTCSARAGASRSSNARRTPAGAPAGSTCTPSAAPTAWTPAPPCSRCPTCWTRRSPPSGRSSRTASTSSSWTPATARTSPTARPSTCTPTPRRWRPRSAARAGRTPPRATAGCAPGSPSCTGPRSTPSSAPTSTPRSTCSGRDLVRLAALGGFGRLGPRVARFLPDERLQRIFSFQALYAGVPPHRALGAYGVIAYMDTVAGVFFPRGGMRAVGQALADAAVAAGAEIHYGRTVTGLERRGGRVTALRHRAVRGTAARPRFPRTSASPATPSCSPRTCPSCTGCSAARRVASSRCATRPARWCCTPGCARPGPSSRTTRSRFGGPGPAPSGRSSTTGG